MKDLTTNEIIGCVLAGTVLWCALVAVAFAVSTCMGGAL